MVLQNLDLKLQKGLILLNERTKFDNGLIKPKFFVLMEEPGNGYGSLIIFMTTSHRISNERMIRFREPFLGRNEAYLILPKFIIVPIGILNRFYAKKGLLDKSEIEKIENAIKLARFIPKRIKERIFFKRLIKQNRNKGFRNPVLGKEMAEFIKKKFGL